jgi:hypothetical protein
MQVQTGNFYQVYFLQVNSMTNQDIIIIPRNLTNQEAAQYCRMTTKGFNKRVENGELPNSLPFTGKDKLWDRKALDAHFDRLSRLTPDNSTDAKKEKAREIC